MSSSARARFRTEDLRIKSPGHKPLTRPKLRHLSGTNPPNGETPPGPHTTAWGTRSTPDSIPGTGAEIAGARLSPPGGHKLLTRDRMSSTLPSSRGRAVTAGGPRSPPRCTGRLVSPRCRVSGGSVPDHERRGGPAISGPRRYVEFVDALGAVAARGDRSPVTVCWTTLRRFVYSGGSMRDTHSRSPSVVSSLSPLPSSAGPTAPAPGATESRRRGAMPQNDPGHGSQA